MKPATDAPLAALLGRSALVVGDAVLDHYVYARPQRLSREAPLPVFQELSSELRPGGAANAALNLAALGAKVRLIAPLCADSEGRELARLLEQSGVELADCPLVRGRPTPRKTRVLAADPSRTPVQVLRLDREPVGELPGSATAALVRRIQRAQPADLSLLCDYGYGAISPATVAAAQARGGALLLDPRTLEGFAPGFFAMTPNLPELAALTGARAEDLDDPQALESTARGLAQRCSIEHLLVTLGNRGMALFSRERPAWVLPASGNERVLDVCGAGDTAAAVFGLALAARLEPERAMELANAASGLVVLELGAVSVDPLDLGRVLPTAPRARLLRPGADGALGEARSKRPARRRSEEPG